MVVAHFSVIGNNYSMDKEFTKKCNTMKSSKQWRATPYYPRNTQNLKKSFSVQKSAFFGMSVLLSKCNQTEAIYCLLCRLCKAPLESPKVCALKLITWWVARSLKAHPIMAFMHIFKCAVLLSDSVIKLPINKIDGVHGMRYGNFTKSIAWLRF